LKRREFITLLGGAAMAWPFAVRAQQSEGIRRIGVLMNLAADEREAQARIAAFLQGLQQLGWTDGGNVRIDYRWAAGDTGRFQRYAEELLALAPDVILAYGLPKRSSTAAGDPHRAHRVRARQRFGLSGKWLELLKQDAPDVTRAAVLRDPDVGTGTTQFAVIQAMAPLLRVEVNPVNVRDPSEIRRAVEAFARSPNGGLIVTASALALHHGDLITMLAARQRLPAVYWDRSLVAAGGLISYGVDPSDQYRRAAGTVTLQ
jgi:putative ABC transport system substrate-binding protein